MIIRNYSCQIPSYQETIFSTMGFNKRYYKYFTGHPVNHVSTIKVSY